MPTLAEGFKNITIKSFSSKTPLLFRMSDNRNKKKRLDLSYAILGYVTDLNQFCKCIAEAEDLQEVWMHAYEYDGNISVSEEHVSKFNLALSLSLKLQFLYLNRIDHLNWDFYREQARPPSFFLALPNNVNLGFQNLRYLSIWYSFERIQSFQALGTFLSRCPELCTLDLNSCGLASFFLPNYMQLDLQPLGEALSQAPSLRCLSLKENHLRWLSDERFDALYVPLSQCRKLVEILGIEAFTLEQQDVLKGMFENNKTYPTRFIDAFLPACTLPDGLKRLILEYIFPQNDVTLPKPMMGFRPDAALVQKKLTFSPEAALLQKKHETSYAKTAQKIKHRAFFY